MDLRHFVTTLASILGLGGCVLSTPFEGPGYDRSGGLSPDINGTLTVSVTYALVKENRADRKLFFDYVAKVEESLPGQKGFVGFSKRADFLGNEVWTLTIWRDPASLQAFVQGGAHKAAMTAAYHTFEDAKFARFEIDPKDLPVGWDRALAALNAGGRHFYE